jgi:hypothetical protein
MGRIKDLDAQGVTDLYSYSVGFDDAIEYVIKKLEAIYDYPKGWDYDNPIESVIAIIKEEK